MISSLFREEIFIELLNVQRLRSAHAHVVANHQCSQLLAVDQQHLKRMAFGELIGRASEGRCSDKHTFACFRRAEASAESPEFQARSLDYLTYIS